MQLGAASNCLELVQFVGDISHKSPTEHSLIKWLVWVDNSVEGT